MNCGEDNLAQKYVGGGLCGFGVLLMVILLPVSVKNVAHNEYGIRYDDLTNTIHSKVYQEGKYMCTPQTTMFLYVSTIQKLTIEMTALTSNGIGVPVIVDIQFQIPKSEVFTIFSEFGEFKRLNSYLKLVGADSIRDSIGKYSAKDFYEYRAVIQDMIEADMMAAMEAANAHVTVTTVVLSNYDFPPELDMAIGNKRSAQNDIAIAENERDGELMEAETAWLVALTNADRVLIEAQAEVDSILAEANAKATSIVEVWANRQSTYDEIKTSLAMTAAQFIDDYLTAIVLQSANSPVISLSDA